MNWDYFAGYFDGEGCLLLNVTRDKRLNKTVGSQVDGWGITPSLSIQSYDYEVIEAIGRFLTEEGYKNSLSNCSRGIRLGQTKVARKLNILGWSRIKTITDFLIPRIIAKRRQLELFWELVDIINLKQAGKQKYNASGVWTKKLFIRAMEKVDEINNLKSRQRGKMNADYFKNLWQEGGDVKWRAEITLNG